ncbi:hypothetical protein PLEOSDRAFT_172222, partial [Pleurotus ostreatus PC15]
MDTRFIDHHGSGLRDEVQPYRNSIVIYEEPLVPGITYYRGKMINAMHDMTFEENREGMATETPQQPCSSIGSAKIKVGLSGRTERIMVHDIRRRNEPRYSHVVMAIPARVEES